MEEKNVPRKREKGGRPPKTDPATKRLTVNLTDVNQLHTTFSDKKAMWLLHDLEQKTVEVSVIGKEVLRLCDEFKAKKSTEWFNNTRFKLLGSKNLVTLPSSNGKR